MGKQRSVTGVLGGNGFHWVGDGFHVVNLFPSGNDLGQLISPFLLMDYHAPYDYAPTDRPRGVGVHPHRGFETVTLAFEGALAHHDSTGAGGIIAPGDVQWMTAAGGILHKEYHEADWARAGGRMHMMQLWVNLPKAEKMSDPGYQPLLAADMGQVVLPGGAGSVNVIAGQYRGTRGPARTFTPINLWEVRLNAGGRLDAAFPVSENTAVFVLDGEVRAGDHVARPQQLLLFSHDGEEISVESEHGAHLLVLNGEPIEEPVFSYGPFVMNEREEIVQAMRDFEAGKFGHLV
ncbi:MAG: pirin family protein [Sporichthyaceae bacterium]